MERKIVFINTCRFPWNQITIARPQFCQPIKEFSQCDKNAKLLWSNYCTLLTVQQFYLWRLYAVQDQVYPEAPTLWHSTCALCASPGYTRCFDRTSVYFCASTLKNLGVPQDFYSPLSLSLEWSGWPHIWWFGIGGFQEQVQCIFVGLVALSFFVFNYFPFLFFSSIGW